jgi:hypothetical protein
VSDAREILRRLDEIGNTLFSKEDDDALSRLDI